MKKFWLILAMGMALISVRAQESASIQLLLNNPVTAHANIGVLIKNLTTGQVIDSYRAQNIIPPASTLKTLTTATALEMLGGDFQFTTRIEYSGTIRQGVLYGDLYIYGGCDPTLGNLEDGQGFMHAWVNKIREAGIQRIEGCVMADLSMLDADAMGCGWAWEDIGSYYGMGVMSLAYMDNTMNVVLRSGPVGTVARVMYTVPEVPGLQFENHIRCTTIDYDGAYIHGMPYVMFRYLTGSIPSNLGQFGVKGDIPNPGLLLAQHLDQRLNQMGIHTTNLPSYITEANGVHRTLLFEHKSLPLREIVRRTNMESVNLYAELIYRYLGTRVSVPGTYHNSEMVVRQFWANRGVDITCARLLDGCGLASQNAISATSLVQLMEYMSRSREREAFFQSLPVSGESGTLKSLLRDSPLTGRVHAKSGTITATRNYAGYIQMPNGDEWAFAILISDAHGKAQHIRRVIEQYLLNVYSANQ